MARAGIALGSNLGDRAANLRQAVSMLGEIHTPGKPLLAAPIYQTKPRLCPPGSPVFLNTVVEIGFEGGADELLELTRAMEVRLGRVPATERNAPRVIDIDLLYLGDTRVESADLVLPHPRIAERRFVLQPLADIRPDLVLPGQSHAVARLLETLDSDEPPLVHTEYSA
jgi:2-amino-4-hydroxy-6-hydroxymethyldihydropteridine diphosphokinase